MGVPNGKCGAMTGGGDGGGDGGGTPVVFLYLDVYIIGLYIGGGGTGGVVRRGKKGGGKKGSIGRIGRLLRSIGRMGTEDSSSSTTSIGKGECVGPVNRCDNIDMICGETSFIAWGERNGLNLISGNGMSSCCDGSDSASSCSW